VLSEQFAGTRESLWFVTRSWNVLNPFEWLNVGAKGGPELGIKLSLPLWDRSGSSLLACALAHGRSAVADPLMAVLHSAPGGGRH
jgi:hypothetical protein